MNEGFDFGFDNNNDDEKKGTTGTNVEKDTAAEVAGFEAGMAQAFEKEKERFKLATESEFYLCLVFQSVAQLEEFVKKAKWADMVYNQWVDGMDVAEKMGIQLENGLLNWDIKNARISQRLAELIIPDDKVDGYTEGNADEFKF